MFKNLVTKLPGAVILGLLLTPLGLAAQTTAEGYDPMIQITHQFAHPDIYILLDYSSSMATDENGNNVGASNTGTPPYLQWTTASGCHTKTCDTWIYTLDNHQDWPSRVNVIKNALGNQFDIYTPWVPPSSWPPLPTVTGGTWSGPVVTHTASDHQYQWTLTLTSAVASDPLNGSPPFTAYDANHNPTIGSGGVLNPAMDLVGKTANVVNWGLLSYGGQGCAVGGSGQVEQVAVDSSDSGDVSKLEAFFRPSAASGTNVGGDSNLLPAILFARDELYKAYDADPKKGCGRTYATIVIAGSQSNNCNDNNAIKNGVWLSSCGACPGPNCCYGQNAPTPYNCPDMYTLYPAGSSETDWTSVHGDLTRLRTFVIGASSALNACELNMTAYMGRTDASSPNGDAGFKLNSATNLPLDPRLPQYVGDTSRYNPAGGNYAFFATQSSGIKDAFMSIVAAVAAGDYATSAPVASSALTTGTAAVLPTTEFPLWKGHLWAFDLNKSSTDHGYVMWDAGWNLAYDKLPADDTASPWVPGATDNPAFVAPADRKIYTWNASNQLVPVTAANLAALNTICGSCGLTANTIDFIRGNDGNGNRRSWVLGSSINSSPAITQKPETFHQGTLESHTSFEGASSPGNRTPLVWVGADDGMLHAFQLSDGKEIFAIIPPNLLANQVKLYSNYLMSPNNNPTGQPPSPADHIYGFAGSPRYGDMFDSSSSSYKTVMLLTEGPGGNLIAGLDVTDPVANLAASKDPVTVLWSHKGGSGPDDWPSLFTTWSTPAAGASKGFSISPPSNSVWTGVVGAGFNASSSRTSQVTPKAMIFNPLTGTLQYTLSPTTGYVTNPSPWVGNQTFADSVIYSMQADAFYADNIVNLALQPDLNGRIWFIPGPNFNSATVGIDATAKITADGYSQQQPIYYSCAVNAFTSGASKYDLYAFGSGTVYEKSAQVTGPNVGQAGYFIPSLYLVAKGQDTSQASNSQIVRIPIQDLYAPEVDASGNSLCPLAADQEVVGTWKQTLCKGKTHVKVGLRTQLTAPPYLFIPIAGAAGNPVALFLIYDPDAPGTCAGYSYIVSVSFKVSATGAPSVEGTAVYRGGTGAASGFAVAGGTVIIGQSAVGEGARAGIPVVPGLNPTQGAGNIEPKWWRELQ